MNITIKVTGSGTSIEVAKALRVLADEIEKDSYNEILKEKGGVVIEDATLLTLINEGVDCETELDIINANFSTK